MCLKDKLAAARYKLGVALAIITDWLLIASGLLLILIALFRIDVLLAKYFLLCCGALFSVFGCWFRQRRLRR
ncbi:hypothetical protein [Candidatus Electronema sp. PJ]|uniref:hypothetical protein n=1 Tax=Candidatus Electronema sp. PJ TaxID=3401572 RepID=UPI003AA80C35